MARRKRPEPSTARAVGFWIAFALTCAALAFGGIVVHRAIQGPGAPDLTPHFAGIPEPAADDDDTDSDAGNDAGADGLTDQERKRLDEALQHHAAATPVSKATAAANPPKADAHPPAPVKRGQ